MKIAHLSDIHVCFKNRPNNIKKARRILEFILNKNVDHIVITGDLTDNADTESFLLLRKLFEEFDILDSQKLTLTIGNHDIFGGVHLAEDILTFPKKCKTTNFQNKVEEFKKYFIESFKDAYFPIPGEVFPYAKVVENCLFIGLNTISPYSFVKNPGASTGWVEKKQIAGLEAILNNPDFNDKTKVIISHHHFYNQVKYFGKRKQNFLQIIESEANKLRNRKKLSRIFERNNVKLVLHGHLHESSQYKINGIQFVNAGGTIERSKTGDLKINFITMNEEIKVRTNQVSWKTAEAANHVLPSNYIEIVSTIRDKIVESDEFRKTLHFLLNLVEPEYASDSSSTTL